MRYQFEWDPAKAGTNLRRHRVSFRQAATVFDDPHQLSVYDEEHSMQEDRWITMGLDRRGVLQIVVHTFRQVEPDLCEIRIISARRATSREARQYHGETK